MMKVFITALATVLLAAAVVLAVDMDLHQRLFGAISAKVASGAHTPKELAQTVLAPDAPGAHEFCNEKVHGEFRRQFDCLTVKHTKKDACCWQMGSGTSGMLPYECCGTGWSESQCESLISAVCKTHHGDL